MKRSMLSIVGGLAVGVVAVAVTLAAFSAPTAGEEKKPKILILTGGEIHDGPGIGKSLEATLKASGKFDLTRVEGDLDALVAPKLDAYDAIVFEWTVGEITDAQKRGLMLAIASGKGVVGIHSACDSFRGDPDWRAFWGGYFTTHPAYQQFQVSVTDEKSPITEGLDRFMIVDEQYILDFDANVKVLANGLWKGKAMPAIWTRTWGKGRVYYMSFGHDPKACEQEVFKTLLVRATDWAAKK
jgi:type 1 glutamine amidotransferase